MTATTLWIACGVVRAEMEELRRRGKIGGRFIFLDSMLHMAPERLEAALTGELARASREARVVLVYGDCCARMLDLAKAYGAGRVDAVNCAQLLLGRDRYREVMREQAFLLLPEWAARWREVVRDEMGLSEPVARDLMREHRRVLAYLDTGVSEVPRGIMEACAAYTGLPWRVETVGLDHLLSGLLDAECAAPAPPRREEPR